jgi:serralysin
LLYGDDGIDTVSYASATAAANVILSAPVYNTGEAKGDTFESIENVIGSNFGEFIYGTDGVNKLQGIGGNDTLVGEGGGDILDGGAGIDTVSYDTSFASTLRVDLLVRNTNTGAAAGDLYISIENLDGSSFNDLLFGDNLNNVIRGSSYPALVSGNDKLDGRGGSDTLNGFDGKDTLTGGLGADYFVFSNKIGSTNIDTITDFKVEDTIRLENTGVGLFNKLTSVGALSTAFFKANATGVATDANDYIVYNTTTGALSYDLNGNAAGGVQQFATLSVHPALTFADFVVI